MAEKWQSNGGIWERKTRKGEDMLSLMIDDKPYIAFRNKHKKPGQKNPDWQVFESKPMENKPKEYKPDEEVPF